MKIYISKSYVARYGTKEGGMCIYRQGNCYIGMEIELGVRDSDWKMANLYTICLFIEITFIY